MKTYYARHTKIALSDETLKSLRESNRIAVHYPKARNHPLSEWPDSESVNPNDYEGSAKRTLRALVRLASEGGYVVASYRDTDKLVVGKVPAGSRIAIEKDKWSADSKEYPGRDAVIKTLAYEMVCMLSPERQLQARAFAPRQSTLTVWHKIGDRIEKLIDGENRLPDLSDLSTDLQEVLCSEFLREPSFKGVPRLSTLLMPIGRTMPDVDICGVAEDGKLLYAQVKFDSKDQDQRVRDLSERYGHADCHLILFSGITHSKLDGRVLQLPLADAYKHFCSTKRGSEWLTLISSSV
jgi:hypothetical protein